MKTKLFLITLLALMTSCSSLQTFMVKGEPGTRIYTPDGQYVAEIDYGGTAELTFDRKQKYAPMYCSFLLSKAPKSDILVPFGIDYTYHDHSIGKQLTGWGIMLASLGTGLGIAIGCADNLALSLGLGIPIAIGGEVAGILIGCFNIDDEVEDSFDVNKMQTTNNDIILK